jgi:putative ABC transport system permease protein
MKSPINPPKWAAQILDAVSNRFNLQEISGDIYELFYKRLAAGQNRSAKFFIWLETLRAILSMWITYQRRKKKSPSIFSNMILSNIKIGIRHILKRPAYSLITIVGLAFGIGACLLIFDYVKYEKSFDQYHPMANRIAMMQYHFKTDGIDSKSPSVPFFVGPKMVQEFPEVEAQTRLLPAYGSRVIKVDDQLFEETNFAFADSTLLSILSYNLSEGNPNDQLSRPNTALLSKHAALRFFGKENPIGKTFLYNDSREFEVN